MTTTTSPLEVTSLAPVPQANGRSAGTAALVAWPVRIASIALVIGSMSVTFALSLAAIVYSGPLAPHLGDGIALTLIGAIVMGIAAPLTLSYRGAIVQPQDVTAVLLALAAATIASQSGLEAREAFSTVVVLVGLSSVTTGVAAYAMGAFRLGYLVRFVPFPVISGFLAASGALLTRGAFDMVVPAAPDGAGAWLSFLAGAWPLWLPWLCLGLVMVWLMRLGDNGSALPALLALALVAFYAAIWMLGLDPRAAQERGLMLGPFEGQSFASGLSFDLLAHVDWSALVTQVPVVLAVIGISLLGTLLNASGLELALERDIDLERELKGVGAANVVAGLGGGMVGYHILAETLLARRFGATGAAAGLTVAGTCAAALFFGAELLSYLPTGLFAAVIWYLGIDLMVTAIRDHGWRMPRLDFAIVLITPIVALVLGFLWAVAFGVIVASLLFVVAYSRVDAVRLNTTGANFHARVERRPEHHSRLFELGGCVQIHKLEGFLFFGSASRLVDRLRKDLGASPHPRFAIVDLKRVVGLDMSAWAAFERLARCCVQQETKLILTGLSPRLKQSFGHGPTADRSARFDVEDDLDDVLMRIENQLLKGPTEETGVSPPSGDRSELDSVLAQVLERYGDPIALASGDVLLAEGARSDHLLFLLSGRCRAWVTDRKGVRHTVNRLLPGAIIGEIAYYADVPRTTTVVAETPATAVRVDAASLDRMERGDPVLAAQFHRSMARILSRRLTTVTRLLRDAEV